MSDANDSIVAEGEPGSREAALAAARRALLLKRIQGGTAPAARQGIPLRPDRERAPLSFAQQRLWFIDQLQPGSPAYNIPVVVHVRGEMDHGVLERAVGEVVRRHDSLRTVIEDDGAEPVQVVAPPAPFVLPVTDVSGSPEPRREAERRARAEAARPFDLARGPLFRAELVRIAPDQHLLLMTVHHVVGDGHSNHILVREVGALYRAFARGLPSPFPELKVQYGDFAVWQRNRLQGAAFEKQLAFWREKLRGAPPVLELPADHVHLNPHGRRGGKVPLSVGSAVVTPLRAMAREEGTTLFNVLLAALAIHLGRFARQDEVVVGTPVDSRGLPELEGIIGIFLNTLPIRTSLEGNPSFREVVRRVRAETAAAFAHQDVQFEKLVDELKIPRSPSQTPIFQVMFTYNEAPAGGPREVESPSFEPAYSDTGTVSFDLGLVIGAQPDAAAGAWSYSADTFRPETAALLARGYESLLARVAADPDVAVSKLALLEEPDRARVLGAWNDTARDYPFAPVHRLFEAQARRTPDAPAVLFEGGAWSYAELDARANRLAHHLRRLGVAPEVRVALALARGPALLEAALAVLKAGGAYVPLDPAYPEERLAYSLRDSGAALLLTEGTVVDALPDVAARVVRVDAEADAIAGEDSRAPGVEVGPDAAAYVIYTSGSTGTPKGVLVEHGSLSNLLRGTAETFGFRAGDVFPALASYAFDIWGFEAYSPLLVGGAVRVVAAEQVRDLEALLAGTADATVLHAVPALMRQVAAATKETPGVLPRLRALFTGGDRVPADLLPELHGAFPGAELRVMYGPTEAAVIASSLPVPRDGATEGHPIGRPLPNVRFYVCDALGAPVLVGAPGELLIGGAGVARGYLGRPDLTAGSFVPDPFGGEPGTRLYRTGDLVRWLPDGTLEFRGRADQQVKVRGFRIEPGEIEAVLRRQPGVGDAVVAAREDVPGDVRLVGYLVAGEDGGTTRGRLRDALAAELPEHMVPSVFVMLDALPLTPTGKVDRKALPAPDARGAADREYVAPRTPVEQVIAAIWSDLLGAGSVSRQDDFFDLGGHSLLATQVTTRARGVKLSVPVRMIFQHPTLEALARAVAAADTRPGQSEKVAALILKVQSLSPAAREQLLRGARE